ncbi:MAG: helix-turn-helix domain-containing protein [Alphaproteobacteria bacterium]|nr:helix-turn-helix domain-containing protein [Alphaproteobacteria bacterium]
MGALRDELAELLGEEGLLALSAERGGRRAMIPRRIPPGHWLEEAVGREAAERMAFHYGGCRIYIPRNPSAVGRAARIRDLRRRGRSVAEIARTEGVSDRHVWRILGRHREGGRPGLT